jgi:hypothetical protein
MLCFSFGSSFFSFDTHGRQRPQGFLPQLDEYYFATAAKRLLENCRCIVPNFINDETLSVQTLKFPEIVSPLTTWMDTKNNKSESPVSELLYLVKRENEECFFWTETNCLKNPKRCFLGPGHHAVPCQRPQSLL